MKMLFLTSNYPSSYRPLSGNIVKEFAKAIRELGVDLRVIHLDERLCWPFTQLKRYRIDRSAASTLEPDPPWLTRYRVRAWPGATGISWCAKKWNNGLMRHISKVWPDFRPDIIHARTFIPCALACEKLVEKWNCAMVISTHGADTRSFIKRHFTRVEILRLCKKGIPIVCVSEAIRKILMDYGVEEKNLHLIYNGMNLSKVYKGEVPLNGKYSGKHLVVGVGNLQPYKAFDIFIEAIARLHKDYPDICGVIVGGGAEESKLRKQIRHLGLDNVVELVGAKVADKAMEYMAACEIFCLPSWSEGFGIVYLEAMAHGKPVIAVNGQGITNVVLDNNVGILVSPRDAVAVADAIKKLIDNRELAQDMGRRAKKLVQEKFSWRYCVLQYIELYKTILNIKRF